jgi:hypothetical protein
MVIFNVNLEVLGEMFDALTQQRNLHFRRAGVRLMNSELLDNSLLLLFSNSHNLRSASLFPYFFVSKICNITIRCCKAAEFCRDSGSQDKPSSLGLQARCRRGNTVFARLARFNVVGTMVSSALSW